MSISSETTIVELPSESIYDSPEDHGICFSALQRQAKLAASATTHNAQQQTSFNSEASSIGRNRTNASSALDSSSIKCVRDNVRVFLVSGFYAEQVRTVRYILVRRCGLASSDVSFTFARTAEGLEPRATAISHGPHTAQAILALPIERPQGIPFVVVELVRKKETDGRKDRDSGAGKDNGIIGWKKLIKAGGISFNKAKATLNKFVKIMSGLY